MRRVKLTLSIDPDLVKQMKVYAIHASSTVSRTTEELWKAILGKSLKKTK